MKMSNKTTSTIWHVFNTARIKVRRRRAEGNTEQMQNRPLRDEDINLNIQRQFRLGIGQNMVQPVVSVHTP
jgi:hypothetical protein